MQLQIGYTNEGAYRCQAQAWLAMGWGFSKLAQIVNGTYLFENTGLAVYVIAMQPIGSPLLD